jgi:uncharacterized protein YecE (DUF72 family)
MARISIGTSGFSYKEWKGRFYPQNLPDREMLQYYATKFSSVEIDSTFYRMPSATTLEGWRTATPDTFRFAVKATQQITHRERLKLPSAALDYWNSSIPTLGSRLAFVLYQLPPFSRCDLERLGSFLSVLPRDIPAAFEFRHDSWLTPEVYAVLERHGAALCITDTEEATTPLILTASATYVRLRRSSYSRAEQEEWRGRFRNWAESGTDVYAYIKHKDNPDAPDIALAFAEGLCP